MASPRWIKPRNHPPDRYAHGITSLRLQRDKNRRPTVSAGSGAQFCAFRRTGVTPSRNGLLRGVSLAVESGVSSIPSVLNLDRLRRREEVVPIRREYVIGAGRVNKGS
jgi:hypothetical protein